MEYTFRKALDTELDRIMEIIEEAKRQMHRDGKVQWDKTYPAREHIEADIKEGTAYVMTHEGRIIAYGAVVFTGEPAYNKIHGKWLSEQPYVVLHRLAVTEDAKGHGVGAMFLQEVERLCRTAGVHSFKVDTNYDNERMLRVLDKLGFTLCGNIFYKQGSRMAFEKLI